MIRCPVLNITSNFSPHVDDTVTLNGRLDPSTSTWMKVKLVFKKIKCTHSIICIVFQIKIKEPSIKYRFLKG